MGTKVPARRTSTLVTSIATAVMAVGMVACSSSGDGGSTIDSAATQTTTSASDGDVFTPIADDGSAPTAQDAVDDGGADGVDAGDGAGDDAGIDGGEVDGGEVVDPIDIVPDTGVPGIDSTDAFCQAWSQYAGSYRALAFAWAIQSPEEASTLEVAASALLRSAAAGLSADLPSELESERDAFTVQLTEPLLRRAERANALLAEFGLDDAAIDALGDAWLVAVTDAGLESENLTVVAPPGTETALAEAAARLRAEIPPITEDPSLIVDAQYPATEQYLFDNCPDQGILAGNDRVDGDI